MFCDQRIVPHQQRRHQIFMRNLPSAFGDPNSQSECGSPQARTTSSWKNCQFVGAPRGGEPVDRLAAEIADEVEGSRIAEILRLANFGFHFDSLSVFEPRQRLAWPRRQGYARIGTGFEFDGEPGLDAVRRNRTDNATRKQDDLTGCGVEFRLLWSRLTTRNGPANDEAG